MAMLIFFMKIWKSVVLYLLKGSELKTLYWDNRIKPCGIRTPSLSVTTRALYHYATAEEGKCWYSSRFGNSAKRGAWPARRLWTRTCRQSSRSSKCRSRTWSEYCWTSDKCPSILAFRENLEGRKKVFGKDTGQPSAFVSCGLDELSDTEKIVLVDHFEFCKMMLTLRCAHAPIRSKPVYAKRLKVSNPCQ